MKVIAIFLFTFVGMMAVNFSMNLLMGESISKSLQDLYGPFWVMEPIENILAYGLVLGVLVPPIVTHFKRRNE